MFLNFLFIDFFFPFPFSIPLPNISASRQFNLAGPARLECSRAAPAAGAQQCREPSQCWDSWGQGRLGLGTARALGRQAGGSGRGSLPGDDGTRTPQSRERDWWPQGDLGWPAQAQGVQGRSHQGGGSGTASGWWQHGCSHHSPETGHSILSLSLSPSPSLSLSLFQVSKQSWPGMWDTKISSSPGIQPSSCLGLWLHLWVLLGPPCTPHGTGAHDKRPDMSCTGTGTKCRRLLPGKPPCCSDHSDGLSIAGHPRPCQTWEQMSVE